MNIYCYFLSWQGEPTIYRASGVKLFLCGLFGKAAETYHRTVYANVRLLRRPGPSPGTEAVTICGGCCLCRVTSQSPTSGPPADHTDTVGLYLAAKQKKKVIPPCYVPPNSCSTPPEQRRGWPGTSEYQLKTRRWNSSIIIR